MNDAPQPANRGAQIGVVAIGRNEGERLRLSLTSILRCGCPVVYVDSGSTDGSQQLASDLGAEVVCLPPGQAFSAARARNSGYRRLRELCPGIEFVQFVDGDCEVVDEWFSTAAQALSNNPRAAVVAGRRRERHLESSIYNRLCDLEWSGPVGESKACGGDALMRVAAFDEVGGYNDTLIAGEEPELCVRLRAAGWKVLRIGAEMTRHDAAMTSFRQWWRRTRRAGHAFAEGAAMHGHSPERHWVRESRSIWFWGLLLPTVSLVTAVFTSGLGLILLAAYPLLGVRIYRNGRRRGLSGRDARLMALFTVVGKFPQLCGQCEYWQNRLLGRRTGLIEYKECAS